MNQNIPVFQQAIPLRQTTDIIISLIISHLHDLAPMYCYLDLIKIADLNRN